MKIVQGLPPGIDAIARALPGALGPRVLFCWGDTIFNPSGADIPPYLIAHEEVHSGQQGTDVEGWWARYCLDPAFRLEQEIPAHIAELDVATQGWKTNRNHRMRVLSIIAHRLSSALYNKLIPLHKAESLLRHAMKEIA